MASGTKNQNNKLGEDESETVANTQSKSVRVWMDGSFDMLHMGHVSAMIQARALGDCLIVGAQSDADVIAHKGPPVHPEQERFRLIQALKCVDEFVGAASYGTSVETLDKYNCDFCVHGDDATLRASDTDVVKQLMRINRAKLVTRGMGLSTTNTINKILQKSEHAETHYLGNMDGQQDLKKSNREEFSKESLDTLSYVTTASQVRAIADASENALQHRGRIVYVDGAFDLFNVGLLSFLEKAALEGDFLLVGVHSDYTVSCRKGPVFPILSMMSRALLILSLKCVSDVIFGAPAVLTREFLEMFKIDVVCRGKYPVKPIDDGADPYAVPKKMGIFKIIDSENPTTSQTIVDRIVSRRAEYVVRNKRKIQQEIDASKLLETSNNSSV